MSKLLYRIDAAGSCFDTVSALAKGRRVFCLTDANTYHSCLPILQEALPGLALHSICIPAGENQKELSTCYGIWEELMSEGAERGSLFIALGGGVVTDIGGFVAATYRRGIPFLAVPTTLLGMVDAAIGGKNGVDLKGYKNMIGTVRQPEEVLVHPPFLRTLDDRQKRSGYAEMLKHAVLDGPELFQRTRDLDPGDEEALIGLLPDSIEVKRRLVESDPYEEGVRESLNFGHTVGHALETLSLEEEEPLLHGEAVAAGMLIEAFMSREVLDFPEDQLEALSQELIDRFGPISLPEDDALLRIMEKDKKKRDGTLRSVLLECMGKPVPAREVEPSVVKRALKAYRDLL